MNKASGKLTVFFEDPFWVGVFEKVLDGRLSACKVTFGSEPKDYEVWEFILKHYYNLNFSYTIPFEMKKSADSPKRRLRNAKNQIQKVGVGTKSQQIIKELYKKSKIERKQNAHKQRDASKQYKFELKQKKRKQKHKGR